MIVSTSKADAMLRKSLGKNQSSIIPINKMIESFKLDPTLANPTRDAYVVTNEDITATKIKQQFEASVQCKHPAVKILFINKSSRPIYEDGFPGINSILQKPNATQISQAIAQIISQDITAADIMSNRPTVTDIPEFTQNNIPDFQPEVTFVEDGPDTPPEPPTDSIPDFVPEPQPVIPTPEPEPDFEVGSNIVNQIKNAGSISEVSVLAREISASSLVKDLIDTSSTYAGIEEKLKANQNMIYAIMTDPGIKSLDEKLVKVRALLHDKAFYNSKGDTLIEQRLEEIIDTIIVQTQGLLESRLSEIDTAIKRSKVARDSQGQSTRLAGLNEERANLIIELTKLQEEIVDIYKSSDMIVSDTTSRLAEQSDDMTGNDVFNAHLKARGNAVISDETRIAISVALDMAATKIPDEFSKMKSDIVTMQKLLSKLFDMDKEVIAAQQYIIDFMKNNRIEDTVVAQSLLKKSLRVFIGADGTGKTIVPYLLSRHKSRQNSNVLLLDLTGTAKYDSYGISYRDADQYFNDLNEERFCVVAGSVENNVANAQRIITSLLKAADYYRVINVVLKPEQKDLFTTISKDVLCVNFLVDTIPEHIDEVRTIIEGTDWTNIAKRVIVNKCDVLIAPIIKRLGLEDSLDYQICTLSSVPAITDACLMGYNPYEISSVELAFEELIKHA